MTDDTTRETRLRNTATRQNLALRKSRRRDPNAHDHGTYGLVDLDTNALVHGSAISGYGLDLDDVEVALAGASAFDVYLRNPMGEYRETQKHFLTWEEAYPFGGSPTRGWLLLEKADTPRDTFILRERNDLAHAAIEARQTVMDWAVADAEDLDAE